MQEIHDHGEELAERFQDYEPKPRARGERQVVDAVAAARRKGMSWQRIGDILGTSAQAAQQRYGATAESA